MLLWGGHPGLQQTLASDDSTLVHGCHLNSFDMPAKENYLRMRALSDEYV